MKIRLSHSALNTFLTCERKFQLDKLLEGDYSEESPSLSFGKGFGAGVASYLLHQDVDRAVMDGYLAYYPVLEDAKKNEIVLVNLLLNTVSKLDDLLYDWEVAYFQGKPAIELSFRLNNLAQSSEHEIYFVGYVDVVLKNRWSGRYAILENKTTSINLYDISPLYKNSGQALGYSIVLDRIAGKEHSEYDVIYLIGQLNTKSAESLFSPKIHVLTYPKTLQDRLNWFIALGMDVHRLEKMLELNVFPYRGNNCLQYMKPCPHFGTCTLTNLDRYKEQEEDEIEYQFVYDLEELIQDHLQRC